MIHNPHYTCPKCNSPNVVLKKYDHGKYAIHYESFKCCCCGFYIAPMNFCTLRDELSAIHAEQRGKNCNCRISGIFSHKEGLKERLLNDIKKSKAVTKRYEMCLRKLKE